ncbi:unnamed protein product [Blepharisma stoltei]|uniref:Uncharacterized protein n=1 Tax=Blepharisma stoltei TaxID=1481888 RepID=A0AAU9J3D5_9CILI|nr:unnamed protein product [Blepharisma stoltei]
MGSCINLQKKRATGAEFGKSQSYNVMVVATSAFFNSDKLKRQNSSKIKDLRRKIWIKKAENVPKLNLSKSDLYIRRFKNNSKISSLSI